MALYRFCIFLFFLGILTTLSCSSDDSIETHGYDTYTDYEQKYDGNFSNLINLHLK